MSWLTKYSEKAARSDRFHDRKDHLRLLAVGLLGETGSVVAEIKKMEREKEAYPAYRQRLIEELGDFLWYYVRLITLVDVKLLNALSLTARIRSRSSAEIGSSLELGTAVGDVLRLMKNGRSSELQAAFKRVWDKLKEIAAGKKISLKDAAKSNLAKTQSRWPKKDVFHKLFDEEYAPEEQIPRRLTIEFREHRHGDRTELLLRGNDINIGDRLTDNSADRDGYRYHDVFHIAYAVFLGWSPVMRALLRCKRKSKPDIDENEDGARAQILEEAVSAIVFSRAKNMRFFKHAGGIDYDLLKSIQEFIKGYEVDQVPVWQWELAIRKGYEIFRSIRSAHGGLVSWDLQRRILTWAPLRNRGKLKAQRKHRSRRKLKK